MWTRTRIAGWRAKAIANGAEREPGEMQISRSPAAAISSTKVAAKRCVTCMGNSIDAAAHDGGRPGRLSGRGRGRPRDAPARLHAEPADVGRGRGGGGTR